LEQIKGLFPETSYLLKNNFYTEMNDYPYADGLISRLFSDRDNRIIIQSIRATKRYIIIKYLLVPGKEGNYSIAHHNSEELYDDFKFYLDYTIFAAFKDTPVVMVIGSQKKAKKITDIKERKYMNYNQNNTFNNSQRYYKKHFERTSEFHRHAPLNALSLQRGTFLKMSQK